MDVVKLTAEKAVLELTKGEVSIVIDALREVCKNIDDWEFETRMGVTMQEAHNILDSLVKMCGTME